MSSGILTHRTPPDQTHLSGGQHCSHASSPSKPIRPRHGRLVCRQTGFYFAKFERFSFSGEGCWQVCRALIYHHIFHPHLFSSESVLLNDVTFYVSRTDVSSMSWLPHQSRVVRRRGRGRRRRKTWMNWRRKWTWWAAEPGHFRPSSFDCVLSLWRPIWPLW